jgi:hypothetical protein
MPNAYVASLGPLSSVREAVEELLEGAGLPAGAGPDKLTLTGDAVRQTSQPACLAAAVP